MYEHTYNRENIDMLIPEWPFIRIFRPTIFPANLRLILLLLINTSLNNNELELN